MVVGEEAQVESEEELVQILTQPLTVCVILIRLTSFLILRFLSCRMGIPHPAYLECLEHCSGY